jgi:monoamine oxidase
VAYSSKNRCKQSPEWTRRRFVKATTLAAGAALTTGLLSRPEKVWSGNAPRIAVIGGGIAGLNAAYQLKKVGLNATVYEARNRLGGRILSVREATGRGLVNDLGGHFVNSDHSRYPGSG